MLDMAILGLLEERDLHGYEIRRQLRDNLGILANVSFGSIYPALTRLEKAGAVMATEGPVGPGTRSTRSATPQAPPTGSLSGELAVLRARRHSTSHSRRGKKVYRITDKGRQLFVQLLADPGSLDDARSFGLRLAFARHLAPQARLALLERRRAQLVQRLAEAEGTNVELDVYARSVVQHTADSVAQDITWLDRLIASERAIPQSTEHAVSAVPAAVHAAPLTTEHAAPQSVPTELTYEGDIR
jgi:DNA-binding PadR family transcriptional regulator